MFTARDAARAHVLGRAATKAECDEPVNGVVETTDPFTVATLWDRVSSDETSTINEGIGDVKVALH